MSFEFIVFDLDNTLYRRGSGVMEEIGRRIQLWLCRELDLSWQEATDLRRRYLNQHGTTMGGLLEEHAVDIEHYLDFVHDFPADDHLKPDPALGTMLEELPLRKVVYTNATSAHARRVLRALGVYEQFEQIVGIEEVGMENKFSPEAYRRMLDLLGTSGGVCVMVEDSPRNLPPAKAVGMTTILVAGERDAEEINAVEPHHVDFTVQSVLEVERIVDQLLADKAAERSGKQETDSGLRSGP